MKLFRDKNFGAKIKSEDVILPEGYLEYELKAQERLRKKEQDLQVEVAEPNDIQEMASDNLVEDDYVESAEAPEDEDIFYEDVLTPEATRKSMEEADVSVKKKRAHFDARLIVIFVTITLLVTVLVCMLSPLMNITEVKINKLSFISEEKVKEMANEPVGQNLFLYSTSKAINNLSLYPYVQYARVKRHFPHYIEIEIKERQPAGILLNNGNYLQFSMDGILLDNSKDLLNKRLPIITGFSMNEVPAPGEHFKNNERFKDALAILNACPRALLDNLQEINLKDQNNILAYTSQGIEVRIGSTKNIEKRIATLNDIMNQVILGKVVKEDVEAIDIRYEKAPVIVLEGYDDVVVVPEDSNRATTQDETQPNQEKEETKEQETPSDEKNSTDEKEN